MAKKNFKQFFSDWLLFPIIAIVIVSLIWSFVGFSARIPSASMESTINEKDRVVVSRLAYYREEPQRGDIIVFRADQANVNDPRIRILIKRIIGVGGDKVTIKNGDVYVNGMLLEEDYADKDSYNGEFEVPQGHFFVMGDNRGNSGDSRLWVHPFVPRKKIMGKAVLKFYPNIKKLQ